MRTGLTAGVVAGCVLLSGCAGTVQTGAAGEGAGSSGFEVSTFDWDGQVAMVAGISGRLAITEEGCTLVYQPGREQLATPVLFPNAVGVRFGNGVRGVADEKTGRLFAVEGGEFFYGGGGGAPVPRPWADRCDLPENGSAFFVNDKPALPMPTEDPAPPQGPLPTRAATAEELTHAQLPDESPPTP